MSRSLQPGTRWVLKRGAHRGAVVDIVRVNKTGVVVRDQGGGANTGKQKQADAERRVPLEQFTGGRYVPYSSLGQADDFGGGHAFRKPKAAPHVKPAANGATVGPLPELVVEPKSSGLTIEVLEVTPSMAQAWLERGGINRRPRGTYIDRLADEMRRGAWRLTGEAIKLDADGMVRDGQNRLHAIVSSGVPIRTLVVRGVDEGAFDVMDTGRSRTVADVLAIRGFPSSTATAGAVRVLMLLENYGRINPGDRSARVLNTPQRVLAYLAEHPDVINGVHLADTLRVQGLQGGVSLWAALFTLFWRQSPELAEQFCQQLAFGEGLVRGDPALLLRARSLNRTLDFSQVPENREYLGALIIKAWNAFVREEKLEQLAYRTEGKRPESFPTIASVPKGRRGAVVTPADVTAEA